MRSSTSLAVLIAFLQASLGHSAPIAIKGSSLHKRSLPGADGALSLACGSQAGLVNVGAANQYLCGNGDWPSGSGGPGAVGPGGFQGTGGPGGQGGFVSGGIGVSTPGSGGLIPGGSGLFPSGSFGAAGPLGFPSGLASWNNAQSSTDGAQTSFVSSSSNQASYNSNESSGSGSIMYKRRMEPERSSIVGGGGNIHATGGG